MVSKGCLLACCKQLGGARERQEKGEGGGAGTHAARLDSFPD